MLPLPSPWSYVACGVYDIYPEYQRNPQALVSLCVNTVILAVYFDCPLRMSVSQFETLCNTTKHERVKNCHAVDNTWMTAWASSLVSRGAGHVTGTFLRPRTHTRNLGFWAQNAPTTRATTSRFRIQPSSLLPARNKAPFCSTGSSGTPSSRIMTTATDSKHEYVKPIDYRLPTNVRPTHYDLTFKTDLESLKFWGYAIIECVSQIYRS